MRPVKLNYPKDESILQIETDSGTVIDINILDIETEYKKTPNSSSVANGRNVLNDIKSALDILTQCSLPSTRLEAVKKTVSNHLNVIV